MMLSRVKPLHEKVISTTAAVDDAEHKMATLDSKRKALEVRLKDLAKGFEDATIDKNDQEKKTIKMAEMLSTATHLRQVWALSLYIYTVAIIPTDSISNIASCMSYSIDFFSFLFLSSKMLSFSFA